MDLVSEASWRDGRAPTPNTPQHYWLMVGLGILGIRLLVLPAIRREAERRCPAVGGRRAHVHSP